MFGYLGRCSFVWINKLLNNLFQKNLENKKFSTIDNVQRITDYKSVKVHEYIDLGLPSGLRWATHNVGASKPEEFGDYFAWGETKPKANYTIKNSETYGKDIDYLRKKGYIDHRGILTPSHDAAYMNWGGTWRMPTLRERDELIKYTTKKCVTLNGVYGCLLQSRLNGNWIFLPFAGEKSIYGSKSEFRYWSPQPNAANERTSFRLDLELDSCYIDELWVSREVGMPIRPVSDGIKENGNKTPKFSETFI